MAQPDLVPGLTRLRRRETDHDDLGAGEGEQQAAQRTGSSGTRSFQFLARSEKPAADNSAPAVELTERRAIVPLLILYIIIAIPVVALCVLILLVPTLFFLAMSVGAVVLGCMALSSAFGAFTIFADVMVVLGAALVVLALGLLFLWIFVWFVGGAIAGLINEIIKLGGKWCFKEVSAA